MRNQGYSHQVITPVEGRDKEVAPVLEKAGSASKKVGLASAAVGAEPVAAFFYPLSNALEGVAGGIHIVKELKDKEYGSAIVRAVFSTYGNKVDYAIVRDKVLDEARKVGYRYVLGETIDATQEKVIDECKQ
ncbi:MAG: hypothetical protein IT274_09310 [Chitinophagales bacterium]|nr:hypothetical protein [Chitinophagales bacterium]